MVWSMITKVLFRMLASPLATNDNLAYATGYGFIFVWITWIGDFVVEIRWLTS